MNAFLDYLRDDGGALKALDEWSQVFWRVDSGDLDLRFAQQGYEDKGYGHIRRIIGNVEELLEKYFEILCDFIPGSGADKLGFPGEMKEAFKPNLILFYTAAHLHDIGIGFPAVFKELVKYLKGSGHNPLHIGEIIHEYHHYAAFIVLMEMSCFEEEYKMEESSYLKNLCSIEKNQEVKKLKGLNKKIEKIYNENFKKFNNILKLQDFKVILAILCLLHKEAKEDHLQSILIKFKEKNFLSPSIEVFNKWWLHFERGKAWTKKIYERFSRTDNLNTSTDFIDAELLKYLGNPIIDLQLVEALLQYGDKTEITIARLVRRPLDKNRNPIKDIPLKKFIDATEYDGKVGDITTKMSQRVISDFARARACYYIPVLLVTVEKGEISSNRLHTPELHIIIHYLRFDGDKDVFKYIRYQDEKDFYDQSFLRVIRFHIPMVIHYYIDTHNKKLINPVFAIKLKKMEHSINDNVEWSLKKNGKLILNDYPETLEGLEILARERRKFPYTVQNCTAINNIVSRFIKKEDKKQVFYESCDMDIPASFELLAVLNLFHKED